MLRRTLLCAMLLITGAVSASAQETQHFVEVSARAEIKVAPNKFKLSILIDEQATKGRTSVEQLEKRMISALQAIEINTQEQLKVNNLYSYTDKHKKSYQSIRYTLSIDSAKRLMECYDALDILGIKSVYLSESTHSDIDRYRDTARMQAVQIAKHKAQAIGAVLNQRVGDCFQIVDRTYYTDSAPLLMRSMSNDAARESAVAPQPLEFNDISISYNIEAKFLLEAAPLN